MMKRKLLIAVLVVGLIHVGNGFALSQGQGQNPAPVQPPTNITGCWSVMLQNLQLWNYGWIAIVINQQNGTNVAGYFYGWEPELYQGTFYPTVRTQAYISGTIDGYVVTLFSTSYYNEKDRRRSISAILNPYNMTLSGTTLYGHTNRTTGESIVVQSIFQAYKNYYSWLCPPAPPAPFTYKSYDPGYFGY